MSLSRKKFLIIGAATSIGQAVTNNLLSQGASVLATVYKKKPILLNQAGVTLAEVNLLDLDSLERFCKTSVADFGKIDVAIFLSGILPGKNLASYDDNLMHQVMTVNFTGQAALLRNLLPHFAENSLVLMVSSISAERGSFDPIYAAAKAAQIGLIKSLATWLAPRIRCNAIAPSLIEDSTMFNDMEPARRAYHLSQTPTARLTTKEDVAGVIIGLCQPEWSNVNGQVIRVNGGSHV